MDTTFVEILERLGTPQDIADYMGVPRRCVYKWREMDSVPSRYWRRLSDSGVTNPEELTDVAAKRR